MNNNGAPALTAACCGNHFEVAKLLFEWDLGVVKRNTRSLLFFAARAGNVRLVRLLLDVGTAVARLVDGGLSALKAACIKGHYEVAVLLLEHGAVCCIPKFKCILYHFCQEETGGGDDAGAQERSASALTCYKGEAFGGSQTVIG